MHDNTKVHRFSDGSYIMYRPSPEHVTGKQDTTQIKKGLHHGRVLAFDAAAFACSYAPLLNILPNDSSGFDGFACLGASGLGASGFAWSKKAPKGLDGFGAGTGVHVLDGVRLLTC